MPLPLRSLISAINRLAVGRRFDSVADCSVSFAVSVCIFRQTGHTIVFRLLEINYCRLPDDADCSAGRKFADKMLQQCVIDVTRGRNAVFPFVRMAVSLDPATISILVVVEVGY
jgi:hypothetical protein